VSARRSGSRARGRGAGPTVGGTICVADHPRVARAVRLATGAGALTGFLLVLLLSLSVRTPAQDALLRALVGGTVAWLAVWAAAVTIGRAAVRAEVAGRRAERLAALRADEEGAVADGGPPA
jgi:hypothetical protein